MEKNNSQLKNRSTESCSTKQNRVGIFFTISKVDRRVEICALYVRMLPRWLKIIEATEMADNILCTTQPPLTS